MPARLHRLLAAGVLAAGLAAPALAQTGPVMLEMSTGATSDATAQYVALHVPSGTDLTGASLQVEDQYGGYLGNFVTFTANPTANAQGDVLVATGSAATLYGVTASVLAQNASLKAVAGRLCLVYGGNEVDCVAWGQYYGGDTGSWGQQVVAGGVLGTALLRIGYTGANTADWQVATPNPAAYAMGTTADGGVADGGVTDGGTSDGGVTDGGVTDGGTSDGGVTDGGTSDGGRGPGSSAGGSVPSGGTVPNPTSGCSCSPTATGATAPAVLLLALGLVLGRRRRPVDPDRGGR